MTVESRDIAVIGKPLLPQGTRRNTREKPSQEPKAESQKAAL